MATNNQNFFATYCRLELESEEQIAQPHGDTIVIGQEIKLKCETYINNRGKDVIRVTVLNLADELLGFLPYREAHRIFDCSKDNWTCCVVPSAVGFKESDRSFWAEVAVFCYSEDKIAILKPFVKQLIERISEGDHPSLSISEKTFERLLSGADIQYELKKAKLPKLAKGEAYYKTKQTQTERMILAAADRKKGCYWGAAAVAIVIAAIIIFIVLKVIK